MVLSVFYVAYAVCEMPSVLLCKYFGPAWFLPLTTLAFGVVTIGTAFCETRGQMIACRFLLGVFEAGMMPGAAYYLSRWYRHAELSFRLGMYMIMTPTAGAFGGLLASGILSLDRVGSLTSWRMIFAIEGIISSGIAVIMLFIMTDNPTTARWLSAEEKELAIARVISERPAQSEVVDKMTFGKFKVGLTNPVTLVSAFVFLCSNISVLGISFFLPTIIRTIYPGKTRVQQQLLTVPPYVVGAVCLITASYLASRFNRRQIFLMATAPTVMAGYAMLLATTNANVRYAAVFLTASFSYFPGSLCNAQVSANTVSDTARSVGISTSGKHTPIPSKTQSAANPRATSHGRLPRRPHRDVDLLAVGRPAVPDRQRPQPGGGGRARSLGDRRAGLDEVRQQEARPGQRAREDGAAGGLDPRADRGARLEAPRLPVAAVERGRNGWFCGLINNSAGVVDCVGSSLCVPFERAWLNAILLIHHRVFLRAVVCVKCELTIWATASSFLLAWLCLGELQGQVHPATPSLPRFYPIGNHHTPTLFNLATTSPFGTDRTSTILAMCDISIRESIRWLPDAASEPTTTIVLTTPQRRFVDIRVLKPTSSADGDTGGQSAVCQPGPCCPFPSLLEER